MIDARLTNHGSIFLLEPLTDAAEEWIADNVDPEAQIFGNSIVIEPRYVQSLVEGMRDDGLEVS